MTIGYYESLALRVAKSNGMDIRYMKGKYQTILKRIVKAKGCAIGFRPAQSTLILVPMGSVQAIDDTERILYFESMCKKLVEQFYRGDCESNLNTFEYGITFGLHYFDDLISRSLSELELKLTLAGV